MVNNSKPEKGYIAICKRCSIKNAQNYVKRHKENYYKYNKEHYEKHGEEDRERRRLQQANNPDKRNSYQRKYYNENFEQFSQYNKNRTYKNHKISKIEWTNCKKYFNNLCAYCGMTLDEHYKLYNQQLHREHIDPNGSIYLNNCVPACKSCNAKKWLSNVEEWYRQQEFFNEERLDKIYKWTNEDYRTYINKKHLMQLNETN